MPDLQMRCWIPSDLGMVRLQRLNHSGSFSPTSGSASKSFKSRKMTLNLIIGVEGSGHHLLRAVARKHLEKSTTVDKGDYYPLLEQRWRPGALRLPTPLVKRELGRIVDQYREKGVSHLYEDTSFPFGPDRTILTRPDIIDLLGLLDGICQISILLLYRSPIETTFSAFRRGFSDSLAQECLYTEASHQHICSQLTSIGDIDFRTLHFHQLLSEKTRCSAALSKWMGIPLGDLDAEACDSGRPVKDSQIPDGSRRYLKAFFDESRVSQWHAVYENKPLVLA